MVVQIEEVKMKKKDKIQKQVEELDDRLNKDMTDLQIAIKKLVGNDNGNEKWIRNINITHNSDAGGPMMVEVRLRFDRSAIE